MKNRNLKLRYMFSGCIILCSIYITPYCIEAAYRFRGYKAYGGEYLVIPLTFIISIFILSIAKEYDIYKSNRIKKEVTDEEWENEE